MGLKQLVADNNKRQVISEVGKQKILAVELLVLKLHKSEFFDLVYLPHILGLH